MFLACLPLADRWTGGRQDFQLTWRGEPPATLLSLDLGAKQASLPLQVTGRTKGSSSGPLVCVEATSEFELSCSCSSPATPVATDSSSLFRPLRKSLQPGKPHNTAPGHPSPGPTWPGLWKSHWKAGWRRQHWGTGCPGGYKCLQSPWCPLQSLQPTPSTL